MIILLILAVISSAVIIIMNYNNRISFYLAGIILGWCLSMTGLLLIISKFGGIYYQVNQVLFINDTVRQFLLFILIPFNIISRMIIYGRSLFMFSLFTFSLLIYRKYKIKNIMILFYINTVLSVLNILVYDPAVFNELLLVLKRDQLYYMSLCVRIWITSYIILTFVVLILKYYHVTIPWLRKKLQYIIFGVFTLSAFYLYLFLGPIEFRNAHTYYYIYSDFSYYNPPLGIYEWFFWIILSAVTLLIMTISIWNYSRVEIKMGQVDISLEKKIRTANVGVNVLNHAIKNQIIMIQMASKQAKESCNNDPANNEVVMASLQKIDEISDGVLKRLEQLHKSLSFNKLQLKPADIKTVMDELSKRISKPGKISLKYINSYDNDTILVDMFYFCEAVQNIVTNAVEAIGNNQGEITIKTYTEENWFVMAIADNGPGIPSDKLSKVFDPFYTNKNSSRNWGVGLSFVKKTIIAHFGRISVKSELDKGTEFFIFLPVL